MFFLKKNSKRILILLSAILLGVIILLVSFLPKNIDISYIAAQYNSDEPHIVQRNLTITMKGKLYRPLFLDTRYEGSCVIEGYDITKEYDLDDIIFSHTNGIRNITYSTIKDDSEKTWHLGNVWIKDDVDAILIWGLAPSGNPEERVRIVAPAVTSEEAEEIMDIWRNDVTITKKKKIR